MALYVAIMLWAAIVALPQGEEPESRWVAIGVMWGTATALAVVHVFAFDLSSRLLAQKRDDPSDWLRAIAQVVAALAVAAIVSVPLLVAGSPRLYDVALWLLAGLIGLIGFAAARRLGATPGRAALAAISAVGVAVAVVAAKLILSH